MSSTRQVPPALAVLGFLGACWYSGVLGMAWDSWSTHYARLQAEKARVAIVRKAGMEQAFPTVCPDYYAASWFDRQWSYRVLRWCEDYRDRFPQEG
jgi:hypothetical protein